MQAYIDRAYSRFHHLIRSRFGVPAYKILWRETPQLLLFYRAFSSEPDFPPGMQPAAQLKAYLLQRGITQATWRLIANGGAGLSLQALYFYRVRNTRAMLDYLLLLQALEFHDQPPWFMWHVMQPHGQSEGRSYRCAIRMQIEIPAFRRIVHLYEHADSLQKASIKENFRNVFRWIQDEGNARKIAPSTLRRAKWDWFLRKAEAWQIERYSKLYERKARSWYTPFRTISVQGYTAVALDSPFMLWQEATAMRHCVESYRARCRNGKAIVVSIRIEGRRRPLATLSARWERDRYVLEQVVGFSNRAPPPNLITVAERIVVAINNASL